MNRELLQEKLHKMQKDPYYRMFSIEGKIGVRSIPELKDLSAYLIMTETEWFAKNGDQLMSSNQDSQNRVLFAETRKKLFLPNADKSALYISPNHPAESRGSFAYFMIHGHTVSAGFWSDMTTGTYYTVQLPSTENNCFCLLDLVITAVANIFPDDIDDLRMLFNLSSNYSAGYEDVFEE